MNKIVKIGVIGCGGIANGKHMPSYAKNPDAKLVAFCDIITESSGILGYNTNKIKPRR